MKVWAYTTIWNEEKMLPFYLKHYSQFCDKIVFFDNESSDNSHEIINSYPNTEIRTFKTGGTLNDYVHLDLKSAAIEEAKGKCDYVIVSDCDEFIYHRNLLEFLKDHLNKTSVFFPGGFQMVSGYFPEYTHQIYESIRSGVPDPWYSKPILINPNMVDNFRWVEGCHEIDNRMSIVSGDIYHPIPKDIRPIGEYKGNSWGAFQMLFDMPEIFNETPLKLLHYKHLGLNYVSDRYNQYIDRVSESNKSEELGTHYERQIAKDNIDFEIHRLLSKAIQINL